MKTQKPQFVAIAAVTIDGKIARHAFHNSDWTSPEDKTFLRAELDSSDVVIVGNNTYKTAKEPLSKRSCIVFTRSVEKTRRENENLLYINPENVTIEGILKDMGSQKVAILGGASIYSYFLQEEMLDDLYLTIEPVIFGKGIPLFNDLEITSESYFTFHSIKELNNTGSLLIHYKKT